MAVTLLEAAKLNSGDIKRSAVIEMFAANSDLLRVLPWEDIPGGSLSYNQEGALPGVAFRGFNEGYSESTGVINPATEVLRIAGGDVDVDKALIKTRGEGIRASQENMKIKALSLHLAGKIINGDSETSNGREFDGLRKRVTGGQLIPANLSTPNASAPLSLEALDAAIDAVDGATHIIMSKDMRRKLTSAERNINVAGYITYSQDEFGQRFARYNDLPILIADYDDLGNQIIPFTEAGPDGVLTNASLYVASFGDGKLTGLQNETMEVSDLGELQAKPVFRTRIEWLVGMAVMHGRAVSRVWGISNGAVTK